MSSYILDPDRPQHPNAAFRDSVGIDWFPIEHWQARYVAHYPMPNGGYEYMTIDLQHSVGIWRAVAIGISLSAVSLYQTTTRISLAVHSKHTLSNSV